MGTDDRFLDLESDPLPHEHRAGVSASTIVSGRGIAAPPGLSPRDLAADFIYQPSAPGPPWSEEHELPKPAPDELAPIHHRQSLLSRRFVRFGMVAVSCALLQLLIVELLNHFGVNLVLANGIGFVVSAQAFFALSALFTWRDRKPRLARHTKSPKATIAGVWVARWAKFNIIALAALAINQVVFVIALHAGVKPIAGSAAGILSGAIVMFGVNHFVTFRNSTGETTGPEIAERRPSLAYLRAKLQEEGVAFILPAFNEAQNLRILVPKLVHYLYALSCPFSVIIVDDGSAADDTYEIAERMSESYTSYVHVVHHPENMGYGAAIQTGLRSALGTVHGLIAFCDADNQFTPESFGTLLAALRDANADVAVGYRIDRADSPKRRIMGSLWHWLSTHMLDLGGVRDVDCGFKIFTRQVLIDVVPRLHGAYATVSPEILARSVAAGYNIVEAGVIHRPRTHGRQTGSDLKVVIRSVVRLFELRRALRKEQALRSARLDGRELAMPEIIPLSDPHHDRVAWLVGFTAAVMSVAAYLITDHLDAVLLYKDSISHLEIARSVLDSTSPGLAQLGAVWLPLPHLVMLPLVWDDTLYHNGFAGSLPSMIAFVVMAVLMYRLVKDLTGHKFAGVVASAVLVINVNMLYMQSTPMTEALLYCFITAMVLFVQRWAATGRYQYLVLGGLASLLGTLTRYESWPIFACLILTVILIARQSNARLAPRIRRASVLDYSIVYIAIGGLGIGAWIVWNWAILKNPLYFQDGQFGKPSLWVASTDPVVGNWWLSFKTYWYAMADTVTWPLLVIAAVGLMAFFLIEWRTKASAMRSLPVLSLLIIFPFFVACLYSGQRPIGVAQVQHYFSNVRFGLMMLMPTAVFVGYLTNVIGKLLRSKPAMYIAGSSLVALALVLNWALVSGHDVVTYSEPLSYHQTGGTANQDEVVGFLEHNYHGGRVLMESYGNEFIAFAIPSNQLVYEGSYLQWLPALRSPAQSRIEWIIMSCPEDNADIVCSTVSRPQLRAYVLAYRTRDGVYLVYRRRM